MLRLLFVALLLFICSTVHAEELPPGSYRLEYGGLYKIAARETNRFLESQWRDQQFILLDNGNINYTQFLRRQQLISDFLYDWRDGPPWWTRDWWWSLTPENGGAPKHPILVRRGRTFNLINNPFFSLSSAFEFRWKNIQATLDFQSETPITVGIGDVPEPASGWKLRFSPEFKFSVSTFLKHPTRAIRRIGLNVGAVRTIRYVRIIAIDITIWYQPNDRDIFIGLALFFLQW